MNARRLVSVLLFVALGPATLDSTPAGNPREPESLTAWQPITGEHGLPDERILALHHDGTSLWVGTQGGLARIEGSTLKSWTRREGLPHEVISAIEVDPATADVWLGTLGGGLIRLSGGRFDSFDQINSGLAGNLVFDVKVHAGRVWAATNGGLSRYDPASDTWGLVLERRLDREETPVTSLAVYEGRLYAAELLRGIANIDEGTEGAFGAGTLRVSATREALWVLTGTRLHRRAAGREPNAHTLPGEGLAPGSIRCLTVDGEGRPWLGTYEGLWTLADRTAGVWVHYSEDGRGGDAALHRDGAVVKRRLPSIFPDNRIRAIASGPRGLWVGTASGLALGTPAPITRQLVEPAGADAPRREPAEPTASHTVSLFDRVDRSISLPWDAPGPRPRIVSADLHAAWNAVAHVQAAGEPSIKLANRLAEFANYGWGQPEDDFAAHAFGHGIAGSVGHLPPGRRISMGVAMLAEVPLVNLSTEDPSDVERLNPWVFRCPVNDYRRHARIMDHAIDSLGCSRIAVLRTDDPLAGLHLDWWVRRAAERGAVLVADRDYDPGDDPGSADVLQELARSRADAILTWSAPESTAALVRSLREAGMDPVVLGSDRVVAPAFLSRVGPRPGLVIAPQPCRHRSDEEGLRRWAEASVSPAVSMSFLTYDGTRHLVEAVLSAGNDRDRVRAVLRKMNDNDAVVLDENRWVKIDLPPIED